jgi:hypothetical protein
VQRRDTARFTCHKRRCERGRVKRREQRKPNRAVEEIRFFSADSSSTSASALSHCAVRSSTDAFNPLSNSSMLQPLTLSLQAHSLSPMGDAIVVLDDRVVLGDSDCPAQGPALPLPPLLMLGQEFGSSPDVFGIGAPAAPTSPEAQYRDDRLRGLLLPRLSLFSSALAMCCS